MIKDNEIQWPASGARELAHNYPNFKPLIAIKCSPKRKYGCEKIK